MMTHPNREELQNGISALSLDCSEENLVTLLAYIDLLKKWNSAYNLLGGNESAALVSRHILDSLSINPYLDGSLIADIGAGAGLPGVPLAILNPDKKFVLIDSNGKKTRFMFQAKIQLGLGNITVENCRIEHYQIALLPDGFELSRSIKLDVPGSESQRHLIEVMRKKIGKL